MKRTKPTLLTVTIAVVVLVVVLIRRDQEAGAEFPVADNQSTVRGRHPDLMVTNPVESELAAHPLSITPSASNAFQRVIELTRSATFYRFDPTIVAFRERTNRNGYHVTFSTRTHAAEVLNGRVIKIMSFYDNSNADTRDENAMKSWYQCTGTFSEADALAATTEVLRKINESDTLAAVSAGRHEYTVIDINVTKPDGEKIRVAPFPTVRFYDSGNILRVKVEYRVGPTGVVGITDWFHNR